MERFDVSKWKREVARRNWQAVDEFVCHANEAMTAMSSELRRQDERTTALVSQVQDLIQEVQALKAGRMGTGPTAR